MACQKEPENGTAKPSSDNRPNNDDNQFGEASSVDKVTLNNKIISMRSKIKKSKVRILSKLIRHIKQLKLKIEEKPVNVEKNKRKCANLVEEMKIMKALKPDTIARFVLGNTCTFVELNNKGFQSIEARALARFSDESLLQDIVTKFRNDHSDWKSLAAFVQTQSSGRQIKKKKINKNTKAKDKKTNIKAKQVMVSSFLQGKVNTNSHKADDESNTEISHETESKPLYKHKEIIKDTKKEVVHKDLDPQQDTEFCLNVKESDSPQINSNKKTKQSKLKNNPPNVKNLKDNLKNSEKELPLKKQETKNPSQNTAMVVKKINLQSFDDNILINKMPKTAEASSEKLCRNDSNERNENELFFFGQEKYSPIMEDKLEKEEKKEKDDEFTIHGNHSMFLSLSDRDTQPFRAGRGRRGRMDFSSHHSDFKQPHSQGRQNNFARGNFSNRGQRKMTSAFPSTKTFQDTTSKQKPLDKSNVNEEKLHPSWEASRKRKEQVANLSAFQGKKIKFDD